MFLKTLNNCLLLQKDTVKRPSKGGKKAIERKVNPRARKFQLERGLGGGWFVRKNGHKKREEANRNHATIIINFNSIEQNGT